MSQSLTAMTVLHVMPDPCPLLVTSVNILTKGLSRASSLKVNRFLASQFNDGEDVRSVE